MKRFLEILAITAITFCACSKTDPDNNQSSGNDNVVGEISIDPSYAEIDAEGGDLTLSLKANMDWWCTSESGLTVTPSSGSGSSSPQSVTVHIDKNSQFIVNKIKVSFSLKDVVKSCDFTVSQASALPQLTSIADFSTKDVNTLAWYTIKGVITSIESKEYGDFYIKDDTGELFVYGMTKTKSDTNDKSFSAIGLNEGDILTFVTIRSEYRGEPQAGSSTSPAYYVSHEKGAPLDPVYKDFKAQTTDAGWMELPEFSANDDFVFLHHGMKIGSKKSRNNSTYFDKKNLTALWVAYPLTRKTIGYGSRTDTWGLDPLLSRDEQPVIKLTYQSVEATQEPEGGYFARGHQLPSADRLAYEANVKTFYGVNIAPQMASAGGASGDPDFNAGVWGDLENTIRVWAKNYDTDTLYVVTGCIPGDSNRYILDNDEKHVTVPSHFYKAILRLSAGEYMACGFYFENKLYPSGTAYKDYSMSIDELETKTGINFFVNLPDDIENKVESEYPVSLSWWWE